MFVTCLFKMPPHWCQTNHVILCSTAGRTYLPDIYKTLNIGRFRPRSYSALTQRYINPKATMILFSTGNITSMGSSTFFGAMRVLFKLKTDLDLKIVNIKLTNIVVNFNFSHLGVVDIQALYEKNRGLCTYDPSIFPCLTYAIENKNIKANIFSSGAAVITGCKDKESIRETIKIVLSKIKECVN